MTEEDGMGQGLFWLFGACVLVMWVRMGGCDAFKAEQYPAHVEPIDGRGAAADSAYPYAD